MKLSLMKYISDNEVPQIDDRIARGLVGHYMESIIPSIEGQVKAICTSSGTGLKLDSMTIASPEEAFNVLSRAQRNVKTSDSSKSCEIYEISHSDFAICRLSFSFRGEEMEPLYTMTPYCAFAPFLMIRDSLHEISPVVGEPAITVTDKPGLFLRLAKFRLNISRDSFPTYIQQFDADTGEVKEIVDQGYITHAKVYKTKERIRPSVNGKTTFGHYLFSHFGVNEAFKRYAKCDIKIGYRDDINYGKLDPKEWTIFSSVKPVRNSEDKGSVMIAVKTLDYTQPTVADLVRAFQYACSLFPERLLPSYLQGASEDDVESEKYVWKLLIGYLTNTSDLGDQRLMQPVKRHFEALGSYIDTLSLQALKMSGCDIDSSAANKANWFFDLMAHFIDTYGKRMISADLSNLYGKHIGILREVSIPITEAVTRSTFGISNHKSDPSNLSAKDVRAILARTIFPREPEQHMRRATFKAASPASLVNGNLLSRASTTVVLQDDSSNMVKKSNKRVGTEDRLLHPSLAETAACFAPRKSVPTGHGAFNPLFKIDFSTSRIVQNPELKEETDIVLSMINGSYALDD